METKRWEQNRSVLSSGNTSISTRSYHMEASRATLPCSPVRSFSVRQSRTTGGLPTSIGERSYHRRSMHNNPTTTTECMGGFGLAPLPTKKAKSPNNTTTQSKTSTAKTGKKVDNDESDATRLLAETQQLLRLVTGNETETLSLESIQQAIILQQKQQRRQQEPQSTTAASKESPSSSGFIADASADESEELVSLKELLVQSKNELEMAHSRIASLQNEVQRILLETSSTHMSCCNQESNMSLEFQTSMSNIIATTNVDRAADNDDDIVNTIDDIDNSMNNELVTNILEQRSAPSSSVVPQKPVVVLKNHASTPKSDDAIEMNELRKQIESLQGQLRESQDEMDQQKQQHEQKCTSHGETVARLEKLRRDIYQQWQKSEQRNTKEKCDLQAKISTLEEALASTETKCNEFEDQYRTQTSSSQQDALQLQSQLSQAIDEQRELKTKIATLEKTLVCSEAKCSDIEEQYRIRSEVVKQELAQLQAQLSNVKFERSAMQSKVVALEESLADNEVKCSDLEKQYCTKTILMQQQVSQLEAQLSDSKVEMNRLRQQRQEDMESAKAQLAAANAAEKSAQNQLLRVRSEHEEKVDALQRELTQTKQHVARQQTDLSQFELVKSELAQNQMQSKRIQEQYEESRQQVDYWKNLSTSSQSEVDQYKKSAQGQISTLQETLDVEIERRQHLMQQLQDLEDAQAQEQEELREAETTIVSLVEELNGLQKSHTVTIAELRHESQTRLDEISKAFIESKRALEKSTKEIHTLQLRTASDSDRISCLEQELREAQLDLERTNQELISTLATIPKPEDHEKVLQDLDHARQEIENMKHMLVDHEKRQENDDEYQELCIAVRKAEQTVTDLRSEVKHLRLDLETTERELDDARKFQQTACTASSNEASQLPPALAIAEQEIYDLRNELDMMKPLASDLEDAEEDLRQTQLLLDEKTEQLEDMAVELHKLHGELERAKLEIAKLEGGMNSGKKCREDTNSTQEETASDSTHASLGSELKDVRSELEQAQRQVSDLQSELDERCHRQKIADERMSELWQQLSEANARSNELQNELETMKQQLTTADATIESLRQQASEDAATRENTRQLLEEKGREIGTLRTELLEQEAHLSSIQKQFAVVDKERNSSRAKLMELSNVRAAQGQENAVRLKEKTLECQSLLTERDSLQQQLALLETKTTILEQDTQKTHEMIQTLVQSSGDGSTSMESIITGLRQEHERTQEKCIELSLQLVESQFKINELTAKIRESEKSRDLPPPSELPGKVGAVPPSASPTKSTGVTRSSFQSFLTNGLDRLSARMDESLPKVDDLKRVSSHIVSATASSSSLPKMRQQAMS